MLDMGRRKLGARILGPHRRPNGSWQVERRAADGTRRFRTLATRGQAEEFVRECSLDLVTEALTIESILVDYEFYLKGKGNKPATVDSTVRRITKFFDDKIGLRLEMLTGARCRRLYKKIVERYAVDTHRNMLNESRSMLKWCGKQGWLRDNPLNDVEGVGKRVKGKPQLSIDEARTWLAKAVEMAANKPGALAAATGLLLGIRPTEIVALQVRDVDDDGHIMRIRKSKTRSGIRTLEIPDVIRPHLLRLTANRKRGDLLFGYHTRDWPNSWVHKVCKAAEVEQVTAQGMRGLSSSVAYAAGTAGHIVAQSLGHANDGITRSVYATPESVDQGKQGAILKVFAGGKK